MKTIEQKVVLYESHMSMLSIQQDMYKYIDNGWLIQTCLERNGRVLVVYKRDLETWN